MIKTKNNHMYIGKMATILMVIVLVFVFNLNEQANAANNDNNKNLSVAKMDLNDIAYNGKSTYVSVGANGEIEISKDGIHVSPVKVLDVTCNLTKVKWTGTQFVAIGDKGTVLSSKDGYSWRISKSTISDKINNFIYNKDCIVLIGDRGAIYTSTNGLNFTLVKSNTAESLNDIIRTKTEFVAVGNKGTIVISKDGIKWAKVKSGITQNLVDVSWNGKKYIAVGGDAILSSSDSKKWIVKHFATNSKNNKMNLSKIAWNKKEIVIAGTDAVLNNYNLYIKTFVFLNSTDGIHWSRHVVKHSMYINSERLDMQLNVSVLDLISANRKFIIFGHDDLATTEYWYDGMPMLIGYIDEGTNEQNEMSDNDWSINFWNPTSDERWYFFEEENMKKVLWDGKSVTLVGNSILRYTDASCKSYILKAMPRQDDSGYLVNKGDKYIDFRSKEYSKDGVYWTYDDKYNWHINIDNNEMTIEAIDGQIVWTGKALAAVAFGEKYNAIVYSFDGVEWFDSKIHGGNFYGVYKGYNNYYEVTTSGAISYISTDGINWCEK